MKILIAPWGNPFAWKETDYVYNNKHLKTKCSTHIIKDVENPEKVIIVCLDTLYDSEKAPKNYSEIINNVEERIKSFIEEKLKENIEEFSVIVCPGIGIFKDKESKKFKEKEFKGYASDYYYYLLYKLSQEFLSLFENKNREFEILIDCTHGINYATILTTNAINEILGILSHTFNITVKVFNSDPYIPGVQTSLNINLIREYKPLSSIHINKQNRTQLLQPNSQIINNKEKTSAIGKELSKLKSSDDVLVFLKSFHFAHPLEFLFFKPDVDSLENLIKKAVRTYMNNVNIRMDEEKLIVERYIRFEPSFENVVKAYVISHLIDNFINYSKKEISLDDIKNVADIFYEKNKEIEYSIINREIWEIDSYSDLIPENWTPYCKIVNKECKCEIDKRNFFAHAGLLYNVIKLKKNNGKIYLRFMCDKLEQIKNLLKTE